MAKLPTILGSRIEAEKAAMVAELCEVLGLPDGTPWATCLEVAKTFRSEHMRQARRGQMGGRRVKPALDDQAQAYFPMRELGDEQE